MKPGDLVRNKNSESGELGTFIGYRVFDGKYECAEVMWFNRSSPNGNRVSTIQKNLIEVVK
tara:strand:- start:3966 stop:4148 length:183 start_codon:yes stop_codon:yes gene_type:complete